MPTYRVYVVDNRSVEYLVDAASEEEAQQLVEESDDADEEFGGKSLDGSQWYVDNVEEVVNEYVPSGHPVLCSGDEPDLDPC